MMTGMNKVLNIEDLRQIARRKLPPPLFQYIEGGADDESNVTGNTTAFGKVDLVPEFLM
ncbi:MAG: L-lactate dehydrogenase (cytochrome), partial [Rhodothermales bacterium]